MQGAKNGLQFLLTWISSFFIASQLEKLFLPPSDDLCTLWKFSRFYIFQSLFIFCILLFNYSYIFVRIDCCSSLQEILKPGSWVFNTDHLIQCCFGYISAFVTYALHQAVNYKSTCWNFYWNVVEFENYYGVRSYTSSYMCDFNF